MTKDQRLDERIEVKLPVTLPGGQSASTHDISASGVYFVTDAQQAIGNTVEFEIQFDMPTGPIRLVAKGRIVRVDHREHQNGVAVQLVESRLETSSPPP
jgi:acyl-coenzyme A thioesterase PaaI-like protein